MLSGVRASARFSSVVRFACSVRVFVHWRVRCVSSVALCVRCAVRCGVVAVVVAVVVALRSFQSIFLFPQLASV